MENQHRKISGYRELDETEIANMNDVKGLGPLLEAACLHVEALPNVDKRWAAIARTHLQQGLMALTRAIARSEFF